MLMKFKGQPNFEVRSKVTGRVVFTFDHRGVYITDCEEIIERAMGAFDYVELKLAEDVVEEAPEHVCKHCGETFENKGQLLAHYRTCKE